MYLSSALASLMKKFSWKLHSRPFDKARPFCSQAVAPATRQRWSFFDDVETESESSVYKHALKFQRPSTIVYTNFQPDNSVSLIGTIDRELRKTNYPENFGLYTWLKVKAFPQSKLCFRVLLKMWDEIAEMSNNHVKPNDFVYVRGHLGSYVKTDGNGDPRRFYEVIVKEINYVAENAEKPIYHKPMQGDDYLERERNRLHLWQVFFANPFEWKDCRKSKASQNHPDFKHIGTGEALWLNHHDPPWVRRQLQLLDSEFAGTGIGERDMISRSYRSFVGNDAVDGNGGYSRRSELKYGT